MGASSKEFVAYVMEQLAPLKSVETGRFFGGIGLRSDGAFFGMVLDNALYFVVDETTRPVYQEMGSRCFSYRNQRGLVNVHRFYEVPADMLEDGEAFVALAEQSITVTRKSAKPRKPTARRRKRTDV